MLIFNKYLLLLNMANTYHQIYIQVVFAVYGRQNLLKKPWRDEIFKYISAIISNKNSKSIIVKGVEDHIHCLIGLNPQISLSSLVRDIKNNSSKFINEKKLVPGIFRWQKGYGAFSYSRSQLNKVYNYILHQETHHNKHSFKTEYFELLKKFNIPHEEKYLFEWIE